MTHSCCRRAALAALPFVATLATSASSPVSAQTVRAAAPPAAAASAPDAPAPQRVEIVGGSAPESNAERRRSTASRIVIGRDEIERQGDNSLSEVLRRLPGVTTGGVPGRGGPPRLRGMGNGYTQILIDGQRMPFGFSLDSIAPDQIERIEIMRAPVAETGTRAIAGTINVIMREDFKRRANELKAGGGTEDGRRAQYGGNWLYSGQNDALGYNVSLSTFRQRLGNQSDSRNVDSDAQGTPAQVQDIRSRSVDDRRGVFATARLQFRLGPGHTLDVQPFANALRTTTDGSSTLDQSVGAVPAPFASSASHTRAGTEMGRLNLNWQLPTPGGGRLQLRLHGMAAHNESHLTRNEFGPGGSLATVYTDDGDTRDSSLATVGKFSQLIADSHSASAGWEIESGRRNDERQTAENGVATLTEFGDTVQARTQRLAFYVQDEWDWSKTFSFYAGLRWESIATRSDSAIDAVDNRSAVLSPLAHLVWRLPDAPRDQVRLSLTRSYRPPTTAQLIARPSINRLAPVGASRKGGNDPNTADRGGNPSLLPELAWGLDLAFEHYLEAGGLASANVFVRQIDNLIRTVREQESVSWADVPRWVARPQNIGSAISAGVEFEAKLRASDLWTTDSALALRGNFSVFGSRVDGVPGPNNRLDQQPRWTLNAGADWPLRGTPLTLGGNLNHTPGFVVQQIDSQVYHQGVKRVIDAYALWRFSGETSARLSVANFSADAFDSGTATTLPDGSASATGVHARSYTTVTLRAELRF